MPYTLDAVEGMDRVRIWAAGSGVPKFRGILRLNGHDDRSA